MLRILHAAEAAAQPIPYYVSLNYDDLFKIQRVHNAFPLKPVSFSSLATYLECPGCALDQRRKKRPKEPKHFTHVHQDTLFLQKQPDPRLVGTLLHQIINLLHDSHGVLSEEQRSTLLTSPDMLTSFVQHDLLQVLQSIEKLKMAMFFDELSGNERLLQTLVLSPLLRYQREIAVSGSTVFAISERFQFKLASTRKTFTGHTDWGGDVALVGEFDQIRLRNVGDVLTPEGIPAIFEFKMGLGKKKSWDKLSSVLDDDPVSTSSDELTQPGIGHAFQLAIYWMAFQTRWDLLEHVMLARGRGEDVRMQFEQDLDLILYNLRDGNQYQLLFVDRPRALQALTNCIFHLNWAMKSGYAWQAPEHECGKTHLLEDVPQQAIQVGYRAISAQECYLLAREAFHIFKEMIYWRKIPAR
jgi:hypothetical protein